MKTRLLFFLVLILSMLQPVFSQETYRQNLEKYWYYRERLKNDFIYYTNDAGILGSHQPAENRTSLGLGQDYIVFADGTLELGYYIGILALEYKLLVDNGQNSLQTLQELTLALDTYDRLDRRAETCFNYSIPDWNGFFLRDDMPQDADRLNYFGVSDIISGYEDNCNQHEGNVISQDQAIGMFFGLTMVKNYVPELKTKAQGIAHIIIHRMHRLNFCPIVLLPLQVWEIENAVTSDIVPSGGKFEELLALCWAHATAAGSITEDNEHAGYSGWPQSLDTWNFAQDLTVDFLSGGISIPNFFILGLADWYIPLQDYNSSMFTMLSTLANEWGTSYDNLYEWQLSINEQTLGWFGMPTDVGAFPHQPLIAKLLYGYDGPALVAPEYYKSHFFNTAPACGAHHYFKDNVEFVTDSPWHTMSLLYPYHNSGVGQEGGDYPMLDYMIMYNAYLCDYYDNPKPYLLVSEDFYPENPNDPVLISVPRRIDGINSVYPGANVTYKAGSEVHLMPGFHAYQCDFHAIIDPTLSCYPIYYEKTTTDPCGQRDFSIRKQTDDTLIDSLIRSESINSTSLNKSDKANVSYSLNDPLQSINFEFNDSNILIFPNPSSGKFFVSLPENENVNEIEVINSYGILILDCISINNNLYIVDLSNQSSGIYYLKLVCNDSIYMHKLIKSS